MKNFYVFAAAAALLLFGAACTQQSAAPSPLDAPEPGQTEKLSTNNSTVSPPAAESGSGNAVSAKAEIAISNFSFNPSSISVSKGTTVVWTNKDPMGHTITVDSGNGPASGLLKSGDTYAYTFASSGSYGYHCSVHPSMRGMVVVTP